jgi:hypothetical protein
LLRLLLVVLLLAGCAGPGLPEGRLVLQEDDGVLRSVHQPVSFGAGVTVAPLGGPHLSLEADGGGMLTLEVSPHARALVVELAGAAAPGGALLHAVPPPAMGRTPALADGATLYATQDAAGYARLVILGPSPGRWGFDVHADALALGFAGQVHASALSTADPEAFTALGR